LSLQTNEKYQKTDLLTYETPLDSPDLHSTRWARRTQMLRSFLSFATMWALSSQ